MADSLDDFFAKKDKKRGKDKGKTVFSAEALVRELEEGARQVEYPTRKENKTSTAVELLGLDADDAGWRDFEDIEKRDYSGLKVKEMSLQDQNEEEQRRLTAEQSDSLPESTPWKMKDETSANTIEPISSVVQKANSSNASSLAHTISDATTPVSSSTDKPQTEEQQQKQPSATNKVSQEGSPDSTEKEGDNKSAKKAYVPPPGRGLAAGEFKVLEPMRMSKSKTIGGVRQGPTPDIQDERLFPSLG